MATSRLSDRERSAPAGRRLADDPSGSTRILLPVGLVVPVADGRHPGRHRPQARDRRGFGIGFAALVIADVTVGLCLFVVVSFLEVLSQIGSFGITKVIGFLLALSWLAYVSTRSSAGEQDFVTSHPTISYLLAIFVAWSGVSLIWAEFPGEALQDDVPLRAERPAVPDRLHRSPRAQARRPGSRPRSWPGRRSRRCSR